MSDAIDFSAEYLKRHGPDAEFVTTDEYGRKFYQFIADYQFGEHRFTIHIWAADEAEAKARVEAIRASLAYEGQIYQAIPVKS